MDSQTVLKYFNSDSVVDYYEAAARKVGLWESEEKIFQKLYKRSDSILELGCGVGRISIGLHELGYANLLATDFAKNMVLKARHLSKLLGYSIPYRVCDALDLEFEDAIFEGAIFGFNGLMQIPKAVNRLQATREIYRVLKPDGLFVFTSHLRSFSKHKNFWKAEEKRWADAEQKSDLDDFGDRIETGDLGAMFIHVPEAEEIEAMVTSVGFSVELSVPRSIIANERAAVREFSDECVFWILRKAKSA